jgi:anaerobic selenocysteine-containing dehydrogenase
VIVARREFLKMLGVATGGLGLGGCDRDWLVPDRLVELAQRGPGLESQVPTICGLCESGCGLTVRLVDGLPVGLKGNPHHPLNRGGLCPVGQAGLEVLYAPNRLQTPQRRGASGELEPVSWDDALDEIGGLLGKLRSEDQGSRVALLTDEPGRLFHDLAVSFTRAVGSPNVSSSKSEGLLPFTLTQGIAQVPGFDLDKADLVMSFGLELFEDGPAPLHAISAMVGSRPTEERAAHIYAGTRLSAGSSKAEIYVPIEPGTHGALALGVAHVLVREGNYDRDFVAEHTFGFEDWIDDQGRERLGFRRLLLERYYPDRIARICGCDAATVVRVARRLGEAAAPLAVAGGEATESSNSTWTGVAVHSLNALLGVFDRPGGVMLPPPIPLSPLVNAEASSPEQTESIFASSGPAGAFGADAVEMLAERVIDGTYPIDLLIVVSSNPVYDSPAGRRLRQAMEQIQAVVVLTSFLDETSGHADFVLPSHVFLESWQGTTTPSALAFSTLGLGKPVIEPLFDTRHPGDVLLELGRAAGGPAGSALPWGSYPDYLKARLEGLVISGEGSVVTGSFEESWVHFLEERGWRFLEHRSLENFWAALERESGWWNPVVPKGDWSRLFQTPSGRFEFFSQTLERHLREVGGMSVDAEMSDEEALERGIAAIGSRVGGDEVLLPHFEPPATTGEGELQLLPFRALTARGRLAAVSPMVLEMFGYPFLDGWQTWAEVATATAHELDLGDGDLVAVESDRGSIEAVVRVHPAAVAGTVHVPLGLGHDQLAGGGEKIGSNPIEILDPTRDNLSGSLAMTSSRVRLRLIRRRPHGGPVPMDGGH